MDASREGASHGSIQGSPRGREPALGDARDAARSILALVRELTGLRVGVCARVDVTTGTVAVVESSDETSAGVARALSLHANAMGFGHVASKGERLCESDLARHPMLRKIPAFSKLGVRSYIGVPVRTSGGGIWGTLAAMDVEKRSLTDAHLRTMTALARLLAFAFERDERQATLAAQTQLLTHRLAAAKELDEENLRAVRLQTVLEAATTVSHEINNPLTVLQLRLGRLAKRCAPEDEETADDLAVSLEAASDINQVTVRLRRVVRPVSTQYLSGKGTMLDLAASVDETAPLDEDSRRPPRRAKPRRRATSSRTRA